MNHDQAILESLKKELSTTHRDMELMGKAGGAGKLLKAIFVPPGDVKIQAPSLHAIKTLNFEKASDPYFLGAFDKEITILKNSDHVYLPKVYKDGKIKIDGKEIPYYVTDFFENGTISKYLTSYGHEIDIFQAMRMFFMQTLDVFSYLHINSIFYHDLKLENLMITGHDKNNPQIRLIDFGSAVDCKTCASEVRVATTIRNWPQEFLCRFPDENTNEGRAPIELKKEEITQLIDLHMISLLFDKFFVQHEKRCDDSKKEYQYLKDIIDRLSYAKNKIEINTISAQNALDMIKKWDQRHIASSRFIDGYLRIPGFGVRHFARPIKEIIDTEFFQRLRKIRQLALVAYVFPGACHSRFEHSIGMMETTINYITALCNNGNAPGFLQDLTEKQIAITILYSLLHDVCHYPFSHVIEEVIAAGGHEKLLDRILSHEDKIMQKLPRAAEYQKELSNVLRTYWGINGLEDIVPWFKFLSNRGSPIPTTDKQNENRTWYVLRDIVNGPIDADKLDYLQRDGYHCGIPYANAIDRDRLFASLSVESARHEPSKLIVTHKGRVCAESIAVARYMLFSEVYWSHSVRSFTVMLQACIEKLLRESQMESEEYIFKELKIFDKSDEEILSTVADKLRSFEPASGLITRKPFSRLYVFTKNADGSIYNLISNARGRDTIPNEGWKSFKQKLKSDLLATVLGKDTKEDDILIDIPDPGRYDIQELKVTSELNPKGEEPIGQLWDGVRTAFNEHARKIRIFVPKLKLPAQNIINGKLIDFKTKLFNN